MQDERLNLRARGLIGLFLAHPGETWAYMSMDRLAKALSERQRALTGPDGETRGAVRKALDDLEATGYLVRRNGGRDSRPKFFIEVFHSPHEASAAPAPEGDEQVAEVYLVGRHGSSVAKIGTTRHLQNRLKGLQAGYPLPLEILWHRPGGWNLEQYLHGCFAELRTEGEWFDFGRQDPVDAVMLAVAKKYPEEFPDWPTPRVLRQDVG